MHEWLHYERAADLVVPVRARSAHAPSQSKSKADRINASTLDFIVEDILQRAGLASGMRVLEIGCGTGDVSMLCAWLVGPSGAVLGIDRSEEAVESRSSALPQPDRIGRASLWPSPTTSPRRRNSMS